MEITFRNNLCDYKIVELTIYKRIKDTIETLFFNILSFSMYYLYTIYILYSLKNVIKREVAIVRSHCHNCFYETTLEFIFYIAF